MTPDCVSEVSGLRPNGRIQSGLRGGGDRGGREKGEGGKGPHTAVSPKTKQRVKRAVFKSWLLHRLGP